MLALGKSRQDGLQRGGVLGEGVARIAADVALIVIEVGILHLAAETLIDGDLRRRRWRRRRRRRRNRYVHRGGGRGVAARSGSRQGIGGGIVGHHPLVARALHRPDTLVDGNARHGTRNLPAQGRRLAALNGAGSAENCETVGAAGGGGGAGAGAGGGGGGGGGTFFLQPEANIASEHAKQMTVIFRLLNMNIAS